MSIRKKLLLSLLFLFLGMVHLACGGGGGGGNNVSTAPTITFTASPISIAAGQTSTLTWAVTNATTVSIDNGIGDVAPNDTKVVTPAATITYTLTATGPGGTNTANATVTVGTTPAVPTVTYSTNPAVYTKDVEITANTPTVTGGTATSFAVSPALPAGLSLDAATGVITGTPTAVTAAADYIVTATIAAGNANVALSVRVTATLLAPSISYTSSPYVFPMGTLITTITPTNTGGAVASWSIAPTQLPAGLNFITSTGQITGTPTAASSATTYTVTATNTAGSDIKTLSITVSATLTAPVISYTPSTYIFPMGTLITKITPTNTGGAVASWSIVPAQLPAGLLFSTSTGQITGTPTVASVATIYTVTATNTAGSDIKTLSITVSASTVSVASVSVSPSTLSLGSGKTSQLSATVLPANATNPSVSWSSSNTSIATVSNGLVTGAAVGGPITITVTTQDGNKTATCQVTVSTSVNLNTHTLARSIGSNPVTLTAAVLPAGSNQTVTWSSDNTSVATVTTAGVVAFIGAGTATITAKSSYNTSDTCQVTVRVASSMRIGTNFWNFGWGNQWRDYVQPGLDWTTVSDPWLPAFLADLAPFNGPIRFMDFDDANENALIHWSERLQKTDNHYTSKTYPIDHVTQITVPTDTQNPPDMSHPITTTISARYFGGQTSINYMGMSYEWMIDLCNRTGKDMWINVPTFSEPAYWTSLATLIRDNLNSDLKCYVEYSNETWNGGFKQYHYTQDMAYFYGLPGGNQWYKAGAWSVWHSLKIFKAFQDVFGAPAMGTRIIRVIAFSGGQSIADNAIQEVVYSGAGNMTFNSTWNPDGQKPDLLAIAPYIGPNDDATGTGTLDGASANMPTLFQANVDWVYSNTQYTSIQRAITISDKYNIPLGCYEGGQQLNTNADVWSNNPLVYDAYTYMLNKWMDAHFVLYCHYTLYGSYDTHGAWGAKAAVTTPLASAHKYRALVDWLAANP